MKPYIIVLTVVSTAASGQFIANDPIDEANLRPWTANDIREYGGVYHFGNSEAESDLFLIVAAEKVYGQIRSGHFSQDGRMWVGQYENVKNIRIEGHKFYSEKANGEFVHYRDENGEISGVKTAKLMDSKSTIRGVLTLTLENMR